jgi:secondary thiamine-phosphate synthase enzyme
MITKRIEVRTTAQTEFIDITHYIRKALTETGTNDGLCNVFVPHTTAGVTINEAADPAVMRDIKMEIDKIIPFSDGYTHLEGNSAAHIKTSLFGVSLSIPVNSGDLDLGRWQGVYFCEFDGPRDRQVQINILSGE